MTEADDLLERIRQEHGEEAARVAAKFIAAPAKRQKHRDLTRTGFHVGVKAKIPKGIPTSHSTNRAWRQDLEERWEADKRRKAGKPGYGPSGLPLSGAPKAPKRPPRLTREPEVTE